MSTAADRNLSHLYPAFRTRAECALSDLRAWVAVHRPGCKALVLETLRSESRQREMIATGKSQTQSSRHLEGLAMDVGLQRGSAIDWNDDEFYAYLGHCARAHGLTWGGDWASFPDCDHVEWDRNDMATRVKARAWVKTL